MTRPVVAATVLAAASIVEVLVGWGGPLPRSAAGAVAFALWISFPVSWGRPVIDRAVGRRHEPHG